MTSSTTPAGSAAKPAQPRPRESPSGVQPSPAIPSIPSQKQQERGRHSQFKTAAEFRAAVPATSDEETAGEEGASQRSASRKQDGTTKSGKQSAAPQDAKRSKAPLPVDEEDDIEDSEEGIEEDQGEDDLDENGVEDVEMEGEDDEEGLEDIDDDDDNGEDGEEDEEMEDAEEEEEDDDAASDADGTSNDDDNNAFVSGPEEMESEGASQPTRRAAATPLVSGRPKLSAKARKAVPASQAVSQRGASRSDKKKGGAGKSSRRAGDKSRRSSGGASSRRSTNSAGARSKPSHLESCDLAQGQEWLQKMRTYFSGLIKRLVDGKKPLERGPSTVGGMRGNKPLRDYAILVHPSGSDESRKRLTNAPNYLVLHNEDLMHFIDEDLVCRHACSLKPRHGSDDPTSRGVPMEYTPDKHWVLSNSAEWKRFLAEHNWQPDFVSIWNDVVKSGNTMPVPGGDGKTLTFRYSTSVCVELCKKAKGGKTPRTPQPSSAPSSSPLPKAVATPASAPPPASRSRANDDNENEEENGDDDVDDSQNGEELSEEEEDADGVGVPARGSTARLPTPSPSSVSVSTSVQQQPRDTAVKEGTESKGKGKANAQVEAEVEGEMKKIHAPAQRGQIRIPVPHRPKVDDTARTELQSQPDPSSQTLSPPKPQTQSPARGQPKTPPQPQSQAQPQTQTQTQPPSQTQAQTHSQTQTQTPSQTPSQTQPQVSSQVPPQTQPQTSPQTQPQTQTQPQPQTQPQTPPQTPSQTQLQTQPQTPSQAPLQTPSQTQPQTQQQSPAPFAVGIDKTLEDKLERNYAADAARFTQSNRTPPEGDVEFRHGIYALGCRIPLAKREEMIESYLEVHPSLQALKQMMPAKDVVNNPALTEVQKAAHPICMTVLSLMAQDLERRLPDYVARVREPLRERVAQLEAVVAQKETAMAALRAGEETAISSSLQEVAKATKRAEQAEKERELLLKRVEQAEKECEATMKRAAQAEKECGAAVKRAEQAEKERDLAAASLKDAESFSKRVHAHTEGLRDAMLGLMENDWAPPLMEKHGIEPCNLMKKDPTELLGGYVKILYDIKSLTTNAHQRLSLKRKRDNDILQEVSKRRYAPRFEKYVQNVCGDITADHTNDSEEVEALKLNALVDFTDLLMTEAERYQEDMKKMAAAERARQELLQQEAQAEARRIRAQQLEDQSASFWDPAFVDPPLPNDEF